jgi:hypothetical protein
MMDVQSAAVFTASTPARLMCLHIKCKKAILKYSSESCVNSGIFHPAYRR